MSIVICPQYAKCKQIYTITEPLKCKKDATTRLPFVQCKGSGSGHKEGLHFDHVGDYKMITTVTLAEDDEDSSWSLQFDAISKKRIQVLHEQETQGFEKNGYRWTESFHVYQPLPEAHLWLSGNEKDVTLLNASVMVEYID